MNNTVDLVEATRCSIEGKDGKVIEKARIEDLDRLQKKYAKPIKQGTCQVVADFS